MKTTLNLDDRLLAEAKRLAAASGRTLTAVLEDALRAYLLVRPRSRPRFRLDLPVERGEAPPAVDVAERDALYELMEDRG